MTMGRPNKGVGHVDGLDAATAEKDRLRAILETITGDLSVEDACARLGIHRAQFQDLRHRALQGAVTALQPGRPGRPPKQEAAEEAIEQLRAEKAELEQELKLTRLRLELAIVLPEVLRPGRSQKGGKMKSG